MIRTGIRYVSTLGVGVCGWGCVYVYGRWAQQSLQGVSQQTIEQILTYYKTATEHDKDWYKVCIYTRCGGVWVGVCVCVWEVGTAEPPRGQPTNDRTDPDLLQDCY